MSSNPSSSVRVTLLGIPLDPVTMPEAVSRLRGFFADDRQHHVMTPNNEMLVEASRNPEFASVLRRSDLNLPDSMGLLLMAKRTGQHLPQRVTGVDTVQALCASLTEDAPVFLLGAAPGVAEKAAEALQSANPGLRVVGTYSGSPADEDATEILQLIATAHPALLLVAFGAPAQDLWIDRHLRELPSVRVAMGVGGTFDFLAGVQVRAPAFLRAAGLEWLWRFIREPSRWKRMWNAVVVFPLLVLRYGKKSPGGH